MPGLDFEQFRIAVEEAAAAPAVGEAAGERPAFAEGDGEARPAFVPTRGRDYGEVKTDLSAFLKEGELPEEYERITKENSGGFVTAEFLPDGTVFYIGRHPVKLEELDGKVFLSFPGISLEKQVCGAGGDPPPRSVVSKGKIELLSSSHRLKIQGNNHITDETGKIILFGGFSYGSGDFKDKILPCVDKAWFPRHVPGEDGQEIDFTDLGSGLHDSAKVEVRVGKIGAGYRQTGMRILDLYIDYFPVGGVMVRNRIKAIPIRQPSAAAAMVKEEEVERQAVAEGVKVGGFFGEVETPAVPLPELQMPEPISPAESAAADDRGERAVETVVVERRVDEGERKSAEIRFSENARRVAELKRKGGENYDLSAGETGELVGLFGETMAALAEMFEQGQRLVLGGRSRTAMELFRLVGGDRTELAKALSRRIPDSLNFDYVDIEKDNRKFAERVEREEDAVGRRVFLESRFREIANWAGNIKRGLGNFQTIEDKQLGQEGMELYLLQKGAMEALARMFEEGITLQLGGKSRTAMELFRMVNSEMSGLENELARRVSVGR